MEYGLFGFENIVQILFRNDIYDKLYLSEREIATQAKTGLKRYWKLSGLEMKWQIGSLMWSYDV